jgi:hypothetical protein
MNRREETMWNLANAMIVALNKSPEMSDREIIKLVTDEARLSKTTIGVMTDMCAQIRRELMTDPNYEAEVARAKAELLQFYHQNIAVN